jgi:hypothetical protein
MSESLASFRDLKGIGPATEARLYEAGVYTWEALGAAASALAAVRGDGDTLREVANLVAAQGTEAEGQAALRLPGGERLEAFVLRMTLAADGEPRRCTVTHVRTVAEQAWAGWTPAELARFIEEHSGLRIGPSPTEEPSRNGDRVAPPSQHRRASPSPQRPSRDHLVVLDAGKAIGGASRDIDPRGHHWPRCRSGFRLPGHAGCSPTRGRRHRRGLDQPGQPRWDLPPSTRAGAAIPRGTAARWHPPPTVAS